MYELADQLLAQPDVLSNSTVLGYPYADVEEMGSAFIVVTDDDRDLAQRLADCLADYLYEHREEFVGTYIGVEEAVDGALQMEGQSACSMWATMWEADLRRMPP